MHQERLREKGYTNENDPTLPAPKAPASKGRGKKASGSSGSGASDVQIVQRLERLEASVQELAGMMQRVVQQLKIAPSSGREPALRAYSERDVNRAISTCLKSKGAGERWVALDDVVGLLKASGPGDREALYKVLADMFYNDRIDLAEGGNPKYPLRIQGNDFGMVALQNG